METTVAAPKMPATEGMDTSLMFLRLLQGPAVRVVVGSGTKPASYILPRNLLSANSRFFWNEFTKLNAHLTAQVASTEKANEPTSDASKDMTATSDSNRVVVSTTPPPAGNSTILLPHIDTDIWAQFLTFIYRGSYTPIYNRPLFAITPSNAHLHVSATPAPTSPSTARPLPVPSAIQAWALGSELGADTFTNYSMTHIYGGAGVHFSITPAVVSWVTQQGGTGAGQPAKLPDTGKEKEIVSKGIKREASPDILVSQPVRAPPTTSMATSMATSLTTIPPGLRLPRSSIPPTSGPAPALNQDTAIFGPRVAKWSSFSFNPLREDLAVKMYTGPPAKKPKIVPARERTVPLDLEKEKEKGGAEEK
ncbi:hypothetical protein BU23DRAFT_598193 [Bimuria novae-zelandiae CBS 107.79]|uniref:Uncharacterized protein n=1 Tax=Bimuria novae-zelandiae CBS 107.79 TaxID=1447943 RepID=A0A6A5VCV0_9PLEO|nr:hypothetical protein BU23DRAFT_598193 [Bimuria novae-zelandiae CBS 107.79]